MAIDIRSEGQFNELVEASKSGDNQPPVLVVHFFADFAEQCKQVDNVIGQMLNDSVEYPSKLVRFCRVAAEELDSLSLRFDVVAVPTIFLFRNGVQVERIDGADIGKLVTTVKASINSASINSASINSAAIDPGSKATIAKTDGQQDQLEDRIVSLLNSYPVILFMKGTVDNPQCGFSRQIVQILNDARIKYRSYNILDDEELRQALKKHSNWPTYPQLYFNGELIGGLDIVRELSSSGELLELGF